jgi:hypothetical protein
MTIRRIARDRRLTPEEAAKYRKVREQVADELPELVARHQQRASAAGQLAELLRQLDTLVRYAEAVGKRLAVSLTDLPA